MMKFEICNLLFVVFSLQFTVSLCDPYTGHCPDFSAAFVAVLNQTIDGPNGLIPDPEMTFFKEDMGLSDDDIQHAFEDAVKFFNEKYGLDFSLSSPNEQKEYIFENATLSLYRFPEDLHYQAVLNNWIQTGNTRTTCQEIEDGGYIVTFSGDQLLHGSYGGTRGMPVGVGNFIVYG